MKKTRKIKKLLAALLALIICGVPTSIYGAENKPAVPEDKISEELYQEFNRLEKAGKDLTREKIPVWIWYKDIDQELVEREVTNQTGLSPENIAVDFEMPSLTLINDLKSEETGSQEKMQQYLGRTTVARQLENQRADTYIMKRREISRKEYNQKIRVF